MWRPDDAVETVSGVLTSDSKNLFDRLNQTVLTLCGPEKRSDIETLCLKESMPSTKVQVRWVKGDSQLASALTKGMECHQLCESERRHGTWRIVFDPQLISGRKRQQPGLERLECTKKPEPQSENVPNAG